MDVEKNNGYTEVAMNISSVNSSLSAGVSGGLSIEEQLEKLEEKKRQIQSGFDKAAENKKLTEFKNEQSESDSKKLEKIESQIAALKNRQDGNTPASTSKTAAPAVKSPFLGNMVDIFA